MPAGLILKHRRGTAALWTSTNTILNDGELGVESDTKMFKFGDGTTAWTSLAYAAISTAAGDTRYLLASAKGQPNGIASLDATGKLPNTQLPSARIARSTVVASQAAMLALSPDDDLQLALRSDNAGTSNPTTYSLNGGFDPTVLANWTAFPVGASLAGAELVANKDAANGYAGLDSGGKLKPAEFPALDGGSP